MAKKKSLSTFVPAAFEFIDSCQLTGSPSNSKVEKTKVESVNSSFQTRGTIKH